MDKAFITVLEMTAVLGTEIINYRGESTDTPLGERSLLTAVSSRSSSAICRPVKCADIGGRAH